uniref:Cell division control protein n=1 Tax=Caenorhabditis japonica TaxID=281687 RepID=A0A8R1E3F7_CAEJA
MSGATKKTRQPRKPVAEIEEEPEVSERRRSTRLTNKPGVSKEKVQKATRRRPVVVPSSGDDSLEISPEKTASIMSPRTAALTAEVESLTISSSSAASSSTSRRRGRTLKKDSSKGHVTPEKKAKTSSNSEEEHTPSPKSLRSSPKEGARVPEEGALKGRTEEFYSLKSWILESKENKTSLSIYISGQPGTGKTATTMRVLKSLGSAVRSCIVNCASTSTKSALFKTIFDSLNLDGKPNVETFEEHVKHRFRVPLVLVLDEIDHLATRKNAALYAAFQWPDTLSHNIIILGIANSIDLTERLLPKLMLAKPPKRLVFEPYTKDDIVEILNEKMKREETIVDAKAIELTARKVAAMSGDLRTALHIFKQQKSRMMPTLSSDGPPVPSTPINGCREVLGIINSVYSSPLARARLPLQPRILLAVSLALSTNKSSNFDRNSLLRAYYKACDAIRVPALDDDDLHSAFQTLESQSFIRQLNGGKLVLQVDAPTAKSAISDNAMLDQIGMLHF